MSPEAGTVNLGFWNDNKRPLPIELALTTPVLVSAVGIAIDYTA